MTQEAERAWQLLRRFLKNNAGASLIEYSILIGLVTAVILGIIIVIGTWMGNAWQSLNTNLPT
jgi:pilus assembly protein Flp/PilA